MTKLRKFRKFWDVFRGYPSRIERETVQRIGEMPDIASAHNRLLNAQKNFLEAVKGVVDENDRLRTGRDSHAQKNS